MWELWDQFGDSEGEAEPLEIVYRSWVSGGNYARHVSVRTCGAAQGGHETGGVGDGSVTGVEAGSRPPIWPATSETLAGCGTREEGRTPDGGDGP